MEKRATKHPKYLMHLTNGMTGKKLIDQYALPSGQPIPIYSVLGENEFLIKSRDMDITANIKEYFELY